MSSIQRPATATRHPISASCIPRIGRLSQLLKLNCSAGRRFGGVLAIPPPSLKLCTSAAHTGSVDPPPSCAIPGSVLSIVRCPTTTALWTVIAYDRVRFAGSFAAGRHYLQISPAGVSIPCSFDPRGRHLYEPCSRWEGDYCFTAHNPSTLRHRSN
jgi:hypothetical protein